MSAASRMRSLKRVPGTGADRGAEVSPRGTICTWCPRSGLPSRSSLSRRADERAYVVLRADGDFVLLAVRTAGDEPAAD